MYLAHPGARPQKGEFGWSVLEVGKALMDLGHLPASSTELVRRSARGLLASVRVHAQHVHQVGDLAGRRHT